MPNVVIVGDRNSGKTTFLTLLYATQVKSGSAVADDFRFHVAIESMDEISGAFQQLMSGSFPDSGTKEGIHQISLHLGYRRPGRGILSRLRSRGWAPGDFTPFRFFLLRNLEGEISGFRKGSSIADVKLRDVLESNAIAILVDSGNLAITDEDHELGSMAKYDGAVESLLTAIQSSRPHSRRGLLHPIFIFSKFDSVEPEALRLANVDAVPPAVNKTGPRTAYAQALLDHNMPKTIAKVKTREPRGTKFATPSYFFSWVHPEGPASGRAPRVRLRDAGASGWEPDYSKDEYVALLDRLRTVALDTAE